MTATASTANRYDLARNRKVNPLDTDGYTQQLSVERKGEVVLDHNEQPGALLGLRVSVDDCILNQLSQAFAGKPARLSGLRAGSVRSVFSHAKAILSGSASATSTESFSPSGENGKTYPGSILLGPQMFARASLCFSSCDFDNAAGKKFRIRCGTALGPHCVAPKIHWRRASVATAPGVLVVTASPNAQVRPCNETTLASAHPDWSRASGRAGLVKRGNSDAYRCGGSRIHETENCLCKRQRFFEAAIVDRTKVANYSTNSANH